MEESWRLPAFADELDRTAPHFGLRRDRDPTDPESWAVLTRGNEVLYACRGTPDYVGRQRCERWIERADIEMRGGVRISPEPVDLPRRGESKRLGFLGGDRALATTLGRHHGQAIRIDSSEVDG